MNPAIGQMLQRYSCENENDYINAMREIMQELELWDKDFFRQLVPVFSAV